MTFSKEKIHDLVVVVVGTTKSLFVFFTLLGMSMGKTLPKSAAKNIAPYEPVGQCPPVQGTYPVYLPDSSNCSIFYECSHGRPHQLNCPAGLHFNSVLNVCTRPQDAGCKANREYKVHLQRHEQEKKSKCERERERIFYFRVSAKRWKLSRLSSRSQGLHRFLRMQQRSPH